MCFGFYCFLWLIVQCILYSFSCIPIQYLFPSMTDMCILSPGICKSTLTPTFFLDYPYGIWSRKNLLTEFIRVGNSDDQRSHRRDHFWNPTEAALEDVVAPKTKILPDRYLWSWFYVSTTSSRFVSMLMSALRICIISVARIPTLRHTATSIDQTSTYATTALLSLAELELAIICTSLPVLRPIIAHFVSGVTSPDAPSTQLGSGRRRTDRSRRAAIFREEPLISTNVSGSTVTNRSFFRSLTMRDEDRQDELPVLAIAETKVIGTKSGQNGEKKLDSPIIVEVNYRKSSRDEEKRHDTPIDFFHRPSLRDGMKKPPPIVPRDLRKDGSQDSSSKSTSPLTSFASSSQGSPRRLLPTPISPLSTQLSGEDSDEPSSARTTNSFLRARQRQGDDFYSTDGLNHSCTPNTDTLTRDVCSMCSSELLPERLRSPTQQLPELPALPSLDEQGRDAGTQTMPSRKRKSSKTRREGDDAVVVATATTTTQSTQTAIPWESSPDTSRPASPQTTESEERVVVEVARQGTIARARERAMQAIAEKTYGQVGEVHHGRARVVQVDTSQRRQAAIGVEEVMGLEAEHSPRRPVGPVQSRKEANRLSGGRSNRPAETVVSKKVQMVEPEPTTSSSRQLRNGVYNGSDAPTKETQQSTSQGSDGEDQTESDLSAIDKRAAATSWLRLSADLS